MARFNPERTRNDFNPSSATEALLREEKLSASREQITNAIRELKDIVRERTKDTARFLDPEEVDALHAAGVSDSEMNARGQELARRYKNVAQRLKDLGISDESIKMYTDEARREVDSKS